jgi:hypothetical protein
MPYTPLTAEVPVKSAAKSKINIGEIIKILIPTLAAFGVVVPEELRVEIMALVAAGGGVYTIVMRTWFNRSVTPSG